MAVPLRPDLLAVLACPRCRGPLREEAPQRRLVCEVCRLAYPIHDEFPSLRPEDGRPVG